MTRKELYCWMEREHLLLTGALYRNLQRTPLEELIKRWLGVLELAKDYEPQRHAQWLAMFFWNSAALTVGEIKFTNLQAEQNRKKLQEEEQIRLRKEKETEAILSEHKLLTWRNTPDKRKLIQQNCIHFHPSYQQWLHEKYLDSNRDLETLSGKEVLLSFWNLIPPFTMDFTQQQAA